MRNCSAGEESTFQPIVPTFDIAATKAAQLRKKMKGGKYGAILTLCNITDELNWLAHGKVETI